LVDYTNTLRREGLSRGDALRRAGPTRLRPIIMTTTALCFGLLPLAAKIEEGSEIYAAMAIVIMGGMLSSTILSLLVVPCMYTYFDDLQNLIKRVWSWRPALPRRRAQAAPAPPPAPAPDKAAERRRRLEEVGSRT
jgi:hydrophobic/amphiphilic exporter-1 (mainly G- bacteria), HAE1 family